MAAFLDRDNWLLANVINDVVMYLVGIDDYDIVGPSNVAPHISMLGFW